MEGDGQGHFLNDLTSALLILINAGHYNPVSDGYKVAAVIKCRESFKFLATAHTWQTEIDSNQ